MDLLPDGVVAGVVDCFVVGLVVTGACVVAFVVTGAFVVDFVVTGAFVVAFVVTGAFVVAFVVTGAFVVAFVVTGACVVDLVVAGACVVDFVVTGALVSDVVDSSALSTAFILDRRGYFPSLQKFPLKSSRSRAHIIAPPRPLFTMYCDCSVKRRAMMNTLSIANVPSQQGVKCLG